MARRYSRGRERRRSEERRFETIIYGMIFLLFLATTVYTALRADYVAVIGGAILIGSAVYQSNRRWRVNNATWIGGMVLLVMGILAIQGGALPGGMIFPIVVLAVVVVVSVMGGDL